MNEVDNHSDVARLRHRIALEQESAQRGLSGLAIVARHEIITARMMRGAERILQLIDEGKHEEAQTMLYRLLCNQVQREGVKPRPDLAFGLFCYVPLHNIWYGIRRRLGN